MDEETLVPLKLEATLIFLVRDVTMMPPMRTLKMKCGTNSVAEQSVYSAVSSELYT